MRRTEWTDRGRTEEVNERNRGVWHKRGGRHTSLTQLSSTPASMCVFVCRVMTLCSWLHVVVYSGAAAP